ncbi:MAG: DUF4304 domain-containing protein [Chitinophagales bacterium]
MKTAKDIQADFIKSYLKPVLKADGFNTNGLTWWKNKGDFFVVINLQNSQWNRYAELSFCLNIGVALTEKLADKQKRKATYYDLAAQVREDAYMTEEREQAKKFKDGWIGYRITDKTNLSEFIMDFKIDLEDNILKILNSFESLDDCIAFYQQFEFWGENLKRQIEECTKKHI